MAVTHPIMRDNMYYGLMHPDVAKMILHIRSQKVISGLSQKVFDFPIELVKRSLEECKSIRRIIKEDEIDHTKYIGKLRDYQTVGTAFMYYSPRSILGDGVGLGKTVEISALINYLKELGQMKRFLMAVETSALGQTQAELIRFTGLNVVQLPSETDKMEKAIKKTDWNMVDGIVVKHSALRSDLLSKWISLNLDDEGACKIFNMFILDESSVIKNPGTKMYQYTENICNIVPRVHFMNATTFETNIMDIYNQMDMMDKNLLPKPWRIEKEYCTYGTKTYWTSEKDKDTGRNKAKMNFSRKLSGYKNQAKFKEALKLVYFGRCKADIGMERPNVYRVYDVEPTNEQSLAMAKGYRYMEVLNCPSLIDDLKIPTDRKHVPKLERLVQIIENDFYDDKVMIYAFHLKAQESIAKELEAIGRKPVILNGEDTDESRWQKMQDFNKTDKYDVIITNIQKSLNLHAADVCIFYALNSNPAKMEQIGGRIDRNVNDAIKTFILLIYMGTDEYKFFTQVMKQRSIDAKSLTINAKGAVDWFIESMQEVEA